MGNTEELIKALAHDATPVTPVSHPFVQCAKWLGGGAVYLALSVMYLGLRPDVMERLHSPLFVAELGLLGGIIVATLLSAALLAFPDMHQKRGAAFAPVFAVLLFVLAIFMAWHADNPPSAMPMHNVECFLCIASISLLPAAWMIFSMRKFASTHPYLAGGIALLCAFSIGALALRLSEPTDSIAHIVEWHYLPMIGITMLGLWVGRVFLKW
jgi:hypothetical protein